MNPNEKSKGSFEQLSKSVVVQDKQPRMHCDLVIFPAVFSVPRSTEGRVVFEAYLERLLDWKQALSEPWLRITTPDLTPEILAKAGCYPIFTRLSELCKDLGIQEFSVSDITRVVNDILSRTPSFEQSCGIRELLVSHCSIASTDCEAIDGFDEYLQDVYVSIAIANQCKCASEPEYIATTGENYDNLTITAKIEDIEFFSGLNLNFGVPASLTARVMHVLNFSTLLKNLDTIKMWTRASTDIEASLVVQLTWLQESGIPDYTDFNDIKFPPFIIGKKFLHSASSFGFHHESVKIGLLLRRLIDIMLGRNLGKAHGLRVGKGGNDPQRKRGTDKAWRIDLDYEFHLHYWILENGTPEFADIVVHNDYSITE